MRRISILSAVLLLGLLVCNAMVATPVSAATDEGQQTSTQLAARGSSTLDDLNSNPTNINLSQLEKPRDSEAPPSGNGYLNPASLPSPRSNNSVTTTNPGFSGFNGLSHVDQRLAGTGPFVNTQFSLEPPDQALCVGNSYVLEAVNTALIVYNKSGTALTAPTAINQFFNLKPEFVRPAGPFGDFTSDPKCYYDTDTNRWFLTILQSDVDPATGGLTGRTHIEIAVSKTGNPTAGWNLFRINTIDDGSDGTPAHRGCPCLPDQPLIGADKYGFYITTNEYVFPNAPNLYNGAQLYAMSKTQLAAGTLPTVIHIDAGLAAPGFRSESVQPATTPPGGKNATGKGGTEYFMSSLFAESDSLAFDNRLAIWELTNTSSLNKAAPKVHLHHVVIRSEAYGGIVVDKVQDTGSAAIAAEQKPGPTPLKDLLNSLGATEVLNKLNMNDDRMNQVVFAGGKLWSGVNTALKTKDGSTRVGIAYFVVSPQSESEDDDNSGLQAEIVKQGYLAVNGNNVMFPSIGVNKSGQAVMVFTLVGPNYFPSAAYASISSEDDQTPVVHLAKSGAVPADGFTGYVSEGGNGVERWGDYTAAVSDADGNIWMATEYIPAGPRTLLANWGTFISKVTPTSSSHNKE